MSLGKRRVHELNYRFPLYAKGVERYRYEYAVFLLNKNIEMVGHAVYAY